MFKSFRKTRSVALALIGIVVVVLVVLPGDVKTANAGFPKFPSLPGGGNVPNIIPGGQQHNNGNLNDLIDLGKKWGSLNDLDNPQRQDEIGQSIALGICNTYPVTKNHALNQYVNKVGLTVAAASPRPDLNYCFGVLETSEIGAYSAPGGYVFVTQGALNLMADESELAGVLAHEVAHVAKNHGINAVKNAKLKELSTTFVQKYGQKWSAYSNQVDSGLQAVMVEGWSQDQEREADREAINYLVATKYDPRGFVRFLQRLQEQGRTSGKTPLKTHPGIGERIRNCSRQIEGLRNVGGAMLMNRFQANVPKVGLPASVPPAPAPQQAPPPQKPREKPSLPFVPPGIFGH